MRRLPRPPGCQTRAFDRSGIRDEWWEDSASSEDDEEAHVRLPAVVIRDDGDYTTDSEDYSTDEDADL